MGRMKQNAPYDLIGIGIGPFNLGMAALCRGLPLSCLFLERNPEFRWHPGMLLDHATLQVPFFADLVTLADPSSPFSFLSFLQVRGRLLRFAFRESLYAYRREYHAYCRWVASRLECLRFNSPVTRVDFNPSSGLYEVVVSHPGEAQVQKYCCRRLVIGTGTEAWMPEGVAGGRTDRVFHSEHYLSRKADLGQKERISVIGSGQSAAEIFYDLLQDRGAAKAGLDWFTAADHFFSMENSRFCYEMASPAYIDYFYGLPSGRKPEMLAGQDSLYLGVNSRLIGEIYDLLYRYSLDRGKPGPRISPGCELKRISDLGNGLELEFFHKGQGKSFLHQTGWVVLATGYRAQVPQFLDPVRDRIRWDGAGRYVVARDYTVDLAGKEIFVQNAELHTHGFNAPDLGLGTYRNACILNTILGKSHFKVEQLPPFQKFGVSDLQGDGLIPTMEGNTVSLPDKSAAKEGRKTDPGLNSMGSPPFQGNPDKAIGMGHHGIDLAQGPGSRGDSDAAESG